MFKICTKSGLSSRLLFSKFNNIPLRLPIRPLASFGVRRLSGGVSSEWSSLESEKKSIETTDEIESVTTTGVIEKGSNREGLLYFDNVYPDVARYNTFRRIMAPALKAINQQLHEYLTQHAIPPDFPVTITNILPRVKDGGVFARYVIDDSEQGKSIITEIADKKITHYFQKHNSPPWFRGQLNGLVRVFKVRGTPWIEDLRRDQSNKLKVTFDGEDLSQEVLYSILRRYGPIVDIIPPSPSSKDLPRSATVIFTRRRDAATARNCVNGFTVEGTNTTIHLSFEPVDRKNILMSWITEHPRIIIPILLALAATLAVIIFEPIRTWSIKRKITGRISLGYWDNFRMVRWIHGQMSTLISTLSRIVSGSIRSLGLWNSRNETQYENLWDERIKSIDLLKQWILDGVGTFIIVHGPKGSGKQELVFNHTLQDHPNVLHINCEHLVKAARSDSSFLRAASSITGYYPVFPWMNGLTRFLDLAVQGLTGQKSGFAESKETQFRNILSTAANAINSIVLDSKREIIGKQDSCPPEAKTASGDAPTAQSVASMSDEDFLQLHPECKPVIVIDNFMSKSEDPQAQFVYDELAEWSGTLIQANIAHVVFITDDVGFDKSLSPALPNHIFKILPVGDANEESAKSFVLRQLGASAGEQRDDESKYPGLDEAIRPLGGRMTDLQALARRLKSGESPNAAVDDMVEQSALEILQMYIMKTKADWTPQQAWSLVKKLATSPDNEVCIDALMYDPNFGSREALNSLSELERCEMIAINSKGGRMISIRAGKPLYQTAFKSLVNDPELAATMEIEVLKSLVAKETSNIVKLEQELTKLAALTAANIKSYEVKSRINYLSDKLYNSQTKIEKYEKSIAHQQKIVTDTLNKMRTN